MICDGYEKGLEVRARKGSMKENGIRQLQGPDSDICGLHGCERPLEWNTPCSRKPLHNENDYPETNPMPGAGVSHVDESHVSGIF